MKLHPAAALIGLPYVRGGEGPETFDCWGLVRFWFREYLGAALPPIAIGSNVDQATSIRQVDEAGWRPVNDRGGKENDIVLMEGSGGLHVGAMIEADGRLLLLHAVEGVGVCAQPLADAERAGFHSTTFWRRR